MSIELGALVVEAVGHFVADDGAHAAVVDGIVRLGVEERRLKDSGGENDFVHQRIVIGVDGGRRHAPFVAVDGLADLGEVAGIFKVVAVANVFGVRGRDRLLSLE